MRVASADVGGGDWMEGMVLLSVLFPKLGRQ